MTGVFIRENRQMGTQGDGLANTEPGAGVMLTPATNTPDCRPPPEARKARGGNPPGGLRREHGATHSLLAVLEHGLQKREKITVWFCGTLTSGSKEPAVRLQAALPPWDEHGP